MQGSAIPQDDRIVSYIMATRELQRGNYHISLPPPTPDEVGQLGRALDELAGTLDKRYQEVRRLNQITTRINAGLLLEEVLEGVYRDFREMIPYNRIGFSLIDNETQTVRAVWAKSELPVVRIMAGFSAPLKGSSLQKIVETRQPRIINDLCRYLELKPDSEATQLIVLEGIRSSLTCPLVANGVPVGFVFFSSTQPHAYANAHVTVFLNIAEQLSVIVEKGRLVSELAARNESIRRQNAELSRLNEQKNAFLGMSAHDLRNPLSNIRMAAELLAGHAAGLAAPERLRLLQDVQHEADAMLSLLNDLLNVAQIESATFSLRPEPLPLAGFLAGIVEHHTQLAAPKKTRVVLEPVPAGEAMADPLRLRQVMDNLISNAVKFAPPATVVQVRARRETVWRVEVQDQGPGITPEDRQRLFQDFARLSAEPTGGEKSTGLSLAITRRVVKAHGGQIDVDSEPGRGAIFWFTLPAAG